MNYDVKFIPNTEDDLHCMQATWMMILKFFMPNFKIEWDEFSKVTGFEKDKGTWALAGLLWFKQHGFEVKHITMFDYLRFIDVGGEYFREIGNQKTADWQISHSNIPIEQSRSKTLINSRVIEQREPNIKDIKNLLNSGYLVHCLINARKINKKDGYIGHAILVKGYTEKELIIHDPGSPPLPERKVKFRDFEAAWADPSPEAKELSAVKLKLLD